MNPPDVRHQIAALAQLSKEIWAEHLTIRKKILLTVALVVILLCLFNVNAFINLWHWYKGNREGVIPLATGIGGLVALLVAFGQFKTARLRHEEQTRADLQRRITESFGKAVEQLASEKMTVRIGGIYTMEL